MRGDREGGREGGGLKRGSVEVGGEKRGGGAGGGEMRRSAVVEEVVKGGGASEDAANILKNLMMEKPDIFKEKGIVRNSDFRAVFLESQGPERETKFICNVCDLEFTSVQSVKGHITRKHVKAKVVEKESNEKETETENGKGVKRRLASPEVQEKEDKRRKASKEFFFEDLEHWSKQNVDKRKENESIQEDDVETTNEIEMSDLAKASEPRLVPVTAFEEWKAEFLDEMKTKEAKIKSLEDQIENNRELLSIVNAEKETLETENNNKDERIERMETLAIGFKEAFISMNEEIDRLNNTRGKTENDEKIKKLKRELKEKDKEVQESQEKKNEALKKLKEESNKRAKTEADNTSLKRQMKNMTTMAEEKSKREEHSRRSRKDKTPERKSPIQRREENRLRSPIFPRRKECSPRRQQHLGENRKKSRSQERRIRRTGMQNRREDDRKRSSSNGRREREWRSDSGGRRSGNNSSQMDDCYWWMQGRCLFGKNCKKGVHIPEKEGIDKNQDFYQAPTGAPGRGRESNQQMMVMVPASQVFGQGAMARGFGSR